MTLKSAIRKLGRAFRAKDEAGIEAAMDDLEDIVEEGKDRRRSDDEEEPEAVEIHNHIPSSDESLGILPAKDPPMSSRDDEEEAAPPWAKKVMDAVGKLTKDVASLKKRSRDNEREEEEDVEDSNLENLGEHAEHDGFEEEPEEGESDRNMSDRRSSNDEPAEREEMAERIRSNQGKDRRDRRRSSSNSDEANEKILGELEFEAPPGTNVKDARRARDSAFLEDSFQDVVAKAEILAPGMRMPSFDRKATPVRTGNALFALRRTALDLAYAKPEMRGTIDAALAGRDLELKRMSHGAVRVLFNAVSSSIATGNNGRAQTRDNGYQPGGGLRTAGPQSIADLNKRNKEVYSPRKAG